MDAILLGPGEGETITERATRTVLLKAGLDAIAVTETRYEPGERGPDPHVHYRHTDAFYVLEGELLFELGPALEAIPAPAGSFVTAPPNVVHTFRNESPSRTRFLNFHTPSERFHAYLRAMRDGADGDWFDQHDPPPDGGLPLGENVFLGPGEGERIGTGGSTVLVKGVAETTDGMFFLSEAELEPGFPGPPPHVHRELHDLFYVLEGMLTLRAGDETLDADPGTFACFPPGFVHAFANTSEAPVRFLNFNTPAGWERYMRDLGDAYTGDAPPTPEDIGRIASRYDFDVVQVS